MTMTRSEMVRGTQSAINELGKGRVSREDAAQVLDTVIEMIAAGIASGEGLTLRNFGSWKVRQYPGKTLPNPQGEGTIEVGPYSVVSFSASQHLKNQVNGRV